MPDGSESALAETGAERLAATERDGVADSELPPDTLADALPAVDAVPHCDGAALPLDVVHCEIENDGGADCDGLNDMRGVAEAHAVSLGVRLETSDAVGATLSDGSGEAVPPTVRERTPVIEADGLGESEAQRLARPEADGDRDAPLEGELANASEGVCITDALPVADARADCERDVAGVALALLHGEPLRETAVDAERMLDAVGDTDGVLGPVFDRCGDRLLSGVEVPVGDRGADAVPSIPLADGDREGDSDPLGERVASTVTEALREMLEDAVDDGDADDRALVVADTLTLGLPESVAETDAHVVKLPEDAAEPVANGDNVGEAEGGCDDVPSADPFPPLDSVLAGVREGLGGPEREAAGGAVTLGLSRALTLGSDALAVADGNDADGSADALLDAVGARESDAKADTDGEPLARVLAECCTEVLAERDAPADALGGSDRVIVTDADGDAVASAVADTLPTIRLAFPLVDGLALGALDAELPPDCVADADESRDAVGGTDAVTLTDCDEDGDALCDEVTLGDGAPLGEAARERLARGEADAEFSVESVADDVGVGLAGSETVGVASGDVERVGVETPEPDADTLGETFVLAAGDCETDALPDARDGVALPLDAREPLPARENVSERDSDALPTESRVGTPLPLPVGNIDAETETVAHAEARALADDDAGAVPRKTSLDEGLCDREIVPEGDAELSLDARADLDAQPLTLGLRLGVAEESGEREPDVERDPTSEALRALLAVRDALAQPLALAVRQPDAVAQLLALPLAAALTDRDTPGDALVLTDLTADRDMHGDALGLVERRAESDALAESDVRASCDGDCVADRTGVAEPDGDALPLASALVRGEADGDALALDGALSRADADGDGESPRLAVGSGDGDGDRLSLGDPVMERDARALGVTVAHAVGEREPAALRVPDRLPEGDGEKDGESVPDGLARGVPDSEMDVEKERVAGTLAVGGVLAEKDAVTLGEPLALAVPVKDTVTEDERDGSDADATPLTLPLLLARVLTETGALRLG